MLEKTEGSRKREQKRMRLLDGITDSMDTSLSIEKDREDWHATIREVAKVGHDLETEQQLGPFL